MDFPQANHNHKQPKRKLPSPNKPIPCKRLSQEQVRLLERSFVLNKRLDPEHKLQIAGKLGVPPRQVAIWYQNRRARWKTQTLELDLSALQRKLDSALEEKERLQKDAEFLRGELKRAQDLILLLSNGENNNPSSSSSPFSVVSNFNDYAASADEGGNGSGGIYDSAVNCCWVDDDDAAMRVEDLYSCFMLTTGSNMD